jgi:hypothetical protein
MEAPHECGRLDALYILLPDQAQAPPFPPFVLSSINPSIYSPCTQACPRFLEFAWDDSGLF